MTKDKVRIFVDSCAWDTLFKNKVELLDLFPSDKFKLLMTKEVRAFEIESIPAANEELLGYIKKQIETCGIETDCFFGFGYYEQSSDYRPRTGGFGQGRWLTYEEGKYLELFKVSKTKLKRTGLYDEEADASLAVRACTGNIVLTAEKKSKPGPLREAVELGGKIVSFYDYQKDMPFTEFLKSSVEAQLTVV